MSDVTRILFQIESGDQQASQELLPLVYGELRHLASRRMAQESPEHSLQPTALVHEAYLRLVDTDKVTGWDSRGHFFAAAAEAMRRILVENARRKSSLKRGGDRQRLSLEHVDITTPENADRFLALNEALEKLAVDHSQFAEIVKLRYFAGLKIDEVAEALGISTATANRHWSFARAWLQAELLADSGAESL
jgi:RNA polymerase sigma factor (TIGR02999 family)